MKKPPYTIDVLIIPSDSDETLLNWIRDSEFCLDHAWQVASTKIIRSDNFEFPHPFYLCKIIDSLKKSGAINLPGRTARAMAKDLGLYTTSINQMPQDERRNHIEKPSMPKYVRVNFKIRKGIVYFGWNGNHVEVLLAEIPKLPDYCKHVDIELLPDNSLIAKFNLLAPFEGNETKSERPSEKIDRKALAKFYRGKGRKEICTFISPNDNCSSLDRILQGYLILNNKVVEFSRKHRHDHPHKFYPEYIELFHRALYETESIDSLNGIDEDAARCIARRIVRKNKAFVKSKKGTKPAVSYKTGKYPSFTVYSGSWKNITIGCLRFMGQVYHIDCDQTLPEQTESATFKKLDSGQWQIMFSISAYSD